MDSDEINCILRQHVGPMFLGVFAADRIPMLNNFLCCYIVNTDPASLPGKHWVAYFHISAKSKEFFDSYGQPPTTYFLPTYPKLMYNTKSFQSLTSNVCGHYCIFYLYRRCRSIPLSRITFTLSNVRDPDQYVCSFVCRLGSRIKSCTKCQSSTCRNKFI
jgi:hypothetical protein